MYSARDNEGHSKVCLILIFKVNLYLSPDLHSWVGLNYGGQVTNNNHIEIPNIRYVQIDQHCVYITYTTHDEQGVTKSFSGLDFHGHSSRSSDKF